MSHGRNAGEYTYILLFEVEEDLGDMLCIVNEHRLHSVVYRRKALLTHPRQTSPGRVDVWHEPSECIDINSLGQCQCSHSRSSAMLTQKLSSLSLSPSS